MYATECLNRLGLGQDADERAIKRAYARELKQIDQEADAAGFQVLREAYEMALHWVKHRPAPVSFAPPAVVPVLPVVPVVPVVPAEPVAPPRDASTGESPRKLAQAVFDEFLLICGEIAAQGDGRDSALWQQHLKGCANDDRLLNISARANFEYLVAHLLVNGWRTGHEGLFVAARQVFGWDKDRRRLKDFGQLGGWMNQAIDESAMYTQQPSGDCSGQADAVTRVRADAEPGKGELLTHVPHLRNMAERFPAWTSIIASTGRIEQWIEMERAIPKWRRVLAYRPKRPDAPQTSSGGWWKFMVAMVLIRIVASAFDGPSTPPSTAHDPGGFFQPNAEQQAQASAEAARAEADYKRAAGKFYIPPGSRKLDPSTLAEEPAPVIKPAPPTGRFLNDAERRAIVERIDFRPRYVKPGTYKVEFMIKLDKHGAIDKIRTKTPSGLPLLDAKTEEAIRASAPFSPQVTRRFGMFFEQRFKERKESALDFKNEALEAAK